MSTWADELWKWSKRTWQRSVDFIGKHDTAMTIVVGFGGLLLCSYFAYRLFFTREVEILAGPQGSIGHNYADVIAEWHRHQAD